MNNNQAEYIASLDVGTTTIRCLILDPKLNIIGSQFAKVNLICPKPGHVEINPEELWSQILEIIKKAIEDAKLSSENIKCIGISTQRSSFINWRKDNGKPFHNFITWKDIRCAKLVKEINGYFSIQAIRWASYCAYLVCRSSRLLAGSRLKLSCNHVTPRLLWAIQNTPNLQEEIDRNNVMFGTIETWLIFKLTGGLTYVTDISNASATGFYDPFTLSWGSWAIHFLKVPAKILPKIVDNDYDFGVTDKAIFGVEIPITAVMADQSAALFGLGCLKEKDIKVTLGTGAFVDVNTLDQIHTGLSGTYPLVGWRINKKLVYVNEAPCNDSGSLIEWLITSGLINDTNDLLMNSEVTKNCDNIFFISAFSGLGPPINDVTAASGFIGITPNTSKNAIVTAVLESIAFRVVLALNVLRKDLRTKFSKISVDGGVSNSDFICQMIADLALIDVERPEIKDTTALGVAFLAGINSGLCKNTEDILELTKIERVFHPNVQGGASLRNKMDKWQTVAKRFKGWNDE